MARKKKAFEKTIVNASENVKQLNLLFRNIKGYNHLGK